MNDRPAKRGAFFSAFRRAFGREEQPAPAPAREQEAPSVEEAQGGDSEPPVQPAEARTVEAQAVEAESLVVEVEPVEEAALPAPPPGSEPPQRLSWFHRLRRGLAKTSTQLAQNIAGVFTKRKLDAETLQELEDLLIQADLGVETSARIADALAKGRHDTEITTEEVRAVLAAEVQRVLAPVAKPLLIPRGEGVQVILVVGVNGTGKTTTIGKLAHSLIGQGSSVMIAAGDTFRAAAIDQLKIWGERTGAEVIARNVGADAAGLAFDALARAREKDCDVLLIDTAGRLQNKQALMDELEKVIRVLRKIDPTAPHRVLLVLDATTGQNALNQVEVFKDKAGVTGLIMTKLDGTARGGILVAISAKFGLPVHAIGVGEAVEDLSEFDAAEFARAIALG
ncbi:MAG TPA: signal recognition particle-docking protein FtsY [Hyphomicrobiaceae bacterium]